MHKTVILPLDERPCNYQYVLDLVESTDIQVTLPPQSLLGEKKRAPNLDTLTYWVEQSCVDATHLIVSIDMLVYGGIIPSRLHYDSEQTLLKRVSVLERIRRENPNITISAFLLIMRNPSYSSSDEEPDYYEQYGRQIHTRGVYEHKKALDLLTKEQEIELEQLRATIPSAYYDDYTTRRRVNLQVHEAVIDLYNRGIIDRLVIPQDDSSPYGLTKMDQNLVCGYIQEGKKPVLMYPGADEVALTLLTHAVCSDTKRALTTYVDYRDPEATDLIPCFEDRPIRETIASQLEACGLRAVSDMEQADLVFFVNNPSDRFRDILGDRDLYNTYKRDTLNNFVNRIKVALSQNKHVCIGDIYFGNGGDIYLVEMLKQEDLLLAIHGYAGWNTASNSVGTALSFGAITALTAVSSPRKLVKRYAEDLLYQAVIRPFVIKNLLDGSYVTYFNTQEKQGYIAHIVRMHMQKELDKLLRGQSIRATITDLAMPWTRIFEIDMEIHCEEQQEQMDLEYVLGVDIGGTKIKIGVITRSGKIQKSVTIDTLAHEGVDQVIHRLQENMVPLIQQYSVQGIGISTAGVVNSANGTILSATDNLPGFTGLRLQEIMEEKFALPTEVCNDGFCAAIGERWLGGGGKYENMVMLTLGTGVGGANIIRGKLVQGPDFTCGNWGHVVLYPKGLPCNCGKDGCIESYISGTALLNRGRELMGNAIVSGKDIIEAYRRGNANARSVMQEYVTYLDEVIIMISEALDPEIIVLGGGVSESFDIWSNLLSESSRSKVCVALLKNDAGLLGGAKLIIDRLER